MRPFSTSHYSQKCPFTAALGAVFVEALLKPAEQRLRNLASRALDFDSQKKDCACHEDCPWISSYRVPISVLSLLARTSKVTVEELSGDGKRGPAPKLRPHTDRTSRPPGAQ